MPAGFGMNLMLSLSALVIARQLGYSKKPAQEPGFSPSLVKTMDAAETRAPVATLGEIRS